MRDSIFRPIITVCLVLFALYALSQLYFSNWRQNYETGQQIKAAQKITNTIMDHQDAGKPLTLDNVAYLLGVVSVPLDEGTAAQARFALSPACYAYSAVKPGDLLDLGDGPKPLTKDQVDMLHRLADTMRQHRVACPQAGVTLGNILALIFGSVLAVIIVVLALAVRFRRQLGAYFARYGGILP